MINDWDKNIVLTQSWVLVKHPPPPPKKKEISHSLQHTFSMLDIYLKDL